MYFDPLNRPHFAWFLNFKKKGGGGGAPDTHTKKATTQRQKDSNRIQNRKSGIQNLYCLCVWT